MYNTLYMYFLKVKSISIFVSASSPNVAHMYIRNGIQILNIRYGIQIRIYSKLTSTIIALVLVACNFYKLPSVEAKLFIYLYPTLDRWLGIIYLVKFHLMCFIYVLKTSPNNIYSQIIFNKLK